MDRARFLLPDLQTCLRNMTMIISGGLLLVSSDVVDLWLYHLYFHAFVLTWFELLLLHHRIRIGSLLQPKSYCIPTESSFPYKTIPYQRGWDELYFEWYDKLLSNDCTSRTFYRGAVSSSWCIGRKQHLSSWHTSETCLPACSVNISISAHSTHYYKRDTCYCSSMGISS